MERGPTIWTSSGKFELQLELSNLLHLDTTDSSANVYQIRRFLASWLCLIADSPLCTDGNLKPKRIYTSFIKEVLSRPLVETIKHYNSLADKLISGTSDLVSDASGPHLFGAGSITGEWLPDFRDTPVFREYHVWYKTQDPQLLGYLLSFLYFGKKLKYEDPQLNATAFRGWQQVEKRLSDLVLDDDVCSLLKLIVERLCAGFEIDTFQPKFGPGAVFEPSIRGKIAKANQLGYNAKLDRAFFRSHFCNYGLSEERGLSVDKVIPDPVEWRSANKISGDVARQRFVPKDVKKSRTICMEPNSFMFFQQGVMHALVETLRRTIAARFINIEDQSRNRELARYGSWSGDIDTIDLSSASDSVSIELVRRIFPRKLLYYLLATRTSKVLTPSGETLRVKKFAPMGSALCFPVQCIVFTSVVILAAMQHRMGLLPGESIPKGMVRYLDVDTFVEGLSKGRGAFALSVDHTLRGGQYKPAAVYGDDICVDSRLTQHVIHLLNSLGFEVNETKSFRGSQAFRESCGGYYFNGEDVTPLFYRVESSKRELTPECVASMIAAVNTYGDRGWRFTSRYLLHILLEGEMQGVRKSNGRNPVAFSSNRFASSHVYHTKPRNWHLRKNRYNPSYQRWELQCVIVTERGRLEAQEFEKPALESYLHLQWWIGKAGAGTSEEFSREAPRFVTSGTRLGRRWIPLQAL